MTKLEINLRPIAGDVSVHWTITRVVNGGLSGANELIAEADSVAHLGDTTASTTALNCNLEAGQRYELAATRDTLSDVDFDVLQTVPQLSFAAVTWTTDITRPVYAMRTTTTLP